MAIADRWSTLLTQQVHLLTASTPLPSASVDIELAVIILPSGDDVLIPRSRALGEQLNIEVMVLKAKALVERGRNERQGGLQGRYWRGC